MFNLSKIGQLADPYHGSLDGSARMGSLLSAMRKGHIGRPLREPQGLLPKTDWDSKRDLTAGSKDNIKLPPPPILRHGPGGAYYAMLARAWGASPELVKSLAPPPIRFDREGARL